MHEEASQRTSEPTFADNFWVTYHANFNIFICGRNRHEALIMSS